MIDLIDTRRSRCAARLAASVVFGLVLSGSGCSRDVRLADKKVPTVTVRSVSHYGLTLDQNATPEQVAFAALRAIREDFLAKNEAEREAALAKQFDLCAAEVLAERNRTSLSRDEYIYSVVYRWTPTVSHYVGDFPADWESAEGRLVRRAVSRAKGEKESGEECEVAMQVADPAGDPKASVVLVVWLAKDGGFWRVLHLGFDPTTRTLTAKAP